MPSYLVAFLQAYLLVGVLYFIYETVKEWKLVKRLMRYLHFSMGVRPTGAPFLLIMFMAMLIVSIMCWPRMTLESVRGKRKDRKTVEEHLRFFGF